MKKLKNLNGIKLVAFCAVLLCLLWLGKNAAVFGYESYLRSGGKMQTVTYSPDDFELIGIVKTENGEYKTTDGDPQLVMDIDMPVARISMECTFSVDPGEMLVYYSEADGRVYSAGKRYWFYAGEENKTLYTAQMPVKNLKSVRIDPTTVAANTMTIENITFNAPKSIGGFFKVEFKDIFNLMVYSAVIATVITLIKETFDGLFAKRSKK